MVKSNFIPDETYGMILQNVPISTVDVYYTNAVKELLLTMRTNKPAQGIEFVQGGRVYKGEARIQTAVRKAKEELGLLIVVDRFIEFGTFDDFFNDSSFQDEKGVVIPAHTISTCYTCVLTPQEIENIKLDTQHKGKRFVNVEQEGDKLHPYIQERRKALKKVMQY